MVALKSLIRGFASLHPAKSPKEKTHFGWDSAGTVPSGNFTAIENGHKIAIYNEFSHE